MSPGSPFLLLQLTEKIGKQGSYAANVLQGVVPENDDRMPLDTSIMLGELACQ